MKHDQVAKEHPYYRRMIEDEALMRLGLPYDIPGVLSYRLPWVKQVEKAHFCSEFTTILLRRLELVETTQLLPSQVATLPIFQERLSL